MKVIVNLCKHILLLIIDKVTKFYDPVVRWKLSSELYLYAKLSHRFIYGYKKDKSEYNEILRIASHIINLDSHLTMIDIGANIGAVTLICYGSFKTGKYYSFEGNEQFFALLEKNMAQVPNSHCEKIFLGNKNEKIRIKINSADSTGSILESSEGQEINILTLDEICKSRKIEPNFIKIDTDGYDFKIIRGSTSLLSSSEKIVLYFEYSPIHQVLHKVEKNPSDIFKFLSQFGFDNFYFYDSGGLFFARFSIDDIDLIDQITQYSFSKITHYNVLTFHRKNIRFKEVYARAEKIYIEQKICKNWGDRWLNRLK